MIRAFLDRLGDTARPIHRRYFRSGVAVERKDDESPVTRSDREAERALRRAIADAFPEDGILGEEFGSERLDARRVWVLDPLDGTRAFVNGKPAFGVMAALLEEGRPVAGLIDMPILSERWIGVAGEPTTFNGVPVSVRDCADLAAASLNATSPDIFPDSASRRRSTACRRPAASGISAATATCTACSPAAGSTSSRRPASRPTTIWPMSPSSKAPAGGSETGGAARSASIRTAACWQSALPNCSTRRWTACAAPDAAGRRVRLT